MRFKNISVIIILYFLFACAVRVSGQVKKCGTFYFDSLITQSDANYAIRKQSILSQFLDSTSAWQNDGTVGRVSDVTMNRFKIPIVVHLLGNTVSSNLSSIDIQNTLDNLNNLFRKTPGTNGDGEGVDTEIEFCLALKDADGNSTTGIINIGGALGPFCKNDDATLKLNSHWDPEKFLNIWVCDLSTCSFKSWSSDPAMYFTNPNTSLRFRDGIVCDVNNFNEKILAEAIGHWLNLRHTFGDDSSSCGTSTNDDGCDDTPWCSGSAASLVCNTINHQCTAKNLLNTLNQSDIRQIENYMDDSDNNCKNMFTLGQKIKMQSTLTNIRTAIANKNTCPTCSDGIKNGNEVGIDCGGDCNPCSQESCIRWVHFRVNGQNTNSGKFINVCNNGNMAISPVLYTQPQCSGIWAFLDVRKSTAQGEYNAFACQWRPLKHLYTCSYEQLFLAIQECDENKNLIGPEYAGWVNFPLYSDGMAFNLYDYLPKISGTIQDGKYYKIKIATIKDRWIEYNSYIKVFISNLSLSNKSIIDDQYADNIHITDGSITSDIKVVAKEDIEILPNSSLTSGSYYIANYDCSQIGSFRGANGSNTEITQFNNESITFGSQQTETKSKIGENLEISIIPNPSDGQFQIALKNASEYPNKIIISNTLGNTVKKISAPKSYTIDLDLTSELTGIYVVKIEYMDKVFMKKLIKK